MPLLGRIEPRLFTPPLRELTPETSYGFAVIAFARDVLGEPLDPWQEWLVIRAGELLPDGRPRFRQVLIIVARQNGKTHLLKVLSLFWLFVEQWPLILGMSTSLETAKDSWSRAVETATSNKLLSTFLEKNAVLRGNNDVHFKTSEGCKYRIAAANSKGGRGMSIDRLIIDELREHAKWDAINAAVPAMNARPFAQAFFITSMGDDSSVVLDSLRESALDFLKTGDGDYRLGIFEWSAPDGMDVLNKEAWVYANPNLGYRIEVGVIEGLAKRAAKQLGEVEAGFRTEYLCQRVRALDAAVNPALWAECFIPGDLLAERGRIVLFIDVSPDQQHASLVAAAVMADGRVRVEVVQSWEGPGCTRKLRNELPGWIEKIRPKVIGWMPNGPAASLAADLADRKGKLDWPPRGVTVSEIREEVSAVCMALAELVQTKQVVHSNQPLLNTHVTGASKLWNGDRWRFSRKGEGHCDAAYAAAGAIHLARTLPTPVGKPRLVVAV